ncbi:MAG TPA: hypothetical protein VN947_16570 [Polyangia bacterium]|nr:hypothetical protein [Polyangia bacterium]
MKKLLVPLLATVLVVALGFVIVELHAPLSPSSDEHASAPPPSPPSAHTSAFAPPSSAAPPTGPARPERPPTLPPVPPPSPDAPDPGDVVVDGKTRTEWHRYYAERQRQMTIDMLKYQTVIDRAIAGEEPDPKELGEAHDHVAEIKGRMKEDLEALQRIDATP